MNAKKIIQIILTIILGIIVFKVVAIFVVGLLKFAISIAIFGLIIYVVYRLFNKYWK